MKKNNVFSFIILFATLFVLCIALVWMFNTTVNPNSNTKAENIVSEESIVDKDVVSENIVYKNKYTLMSEISSLSNQITNGKKNGEDVSKLILQYGILYAQLHELKGK